MFPGSGEQCRQLVVLLAEREAAARITRRCSPISATAPMLAAAPPPLAAARTRKRVGSWRAKPIASESRTSSVGFRHSGKRRGSSGSGGARSSSGLRTAARRLGFPGLAAELRASHHSIQPVPCEVDITAADLAPFLSGFASAEAHFGASPEGSPAFVINLRADDAPLLQLFQRTFEVGHLTDIAPAGRSSGRSPGAWGD